MSFLIFFNFQCHRTNAFHGTYHNGQIVGVYQSRIVHRIKPTGKTTCYNPKISFYYLHSFLWLQTFETGNLILIQVMLTYNDKK